jgi:hypothetical protein
VWAVDPEAVTYRAGLRFEELCPPIWEEPGRGAWQPPPHGASAGRGKDGAGADEAGQTEQVTATEFGLHVCRPSMSNGPPRASSPAIRTGLKRGRLIDRSGIRN